MYVLLITQLLRLVGRLSARNPFKHTRMLTAVSPSDRPKLVRNRCVIEVFVSVFLCCYDAFWIFLWVEGLLSYDWVRYLPFSQTCSDWCTNSPILKNCAWTRKIIIILCVIWLARESFSSFMKTSLLLNFSYQWHVHYSTVFAKSTNDFTYDIGK